MTWVKPALPSTFVPSLQNGHQLAVKLTWWKDSSASRLKPTWQTTFIPSLKNAQRSTEKLIWKDSYAVLHTEVPPGGRLRRTFLRDLSL